ncbi:hypothetical protein R3I93_013874 [Phoxinus phoxinus]|uniref:Uncharacterized protein n=1 Tax=Phoxinus phoxinus TaxID=58324 RepID=A0AAN9CTF7_9TELE
MMAENTDDNVPQNKTRQSKDYPPNFIPGETLEQITDSSMSDDHPECSRTENKNENQKQKKCSARWDVDIKSDQSDQSIISDDTFFRNDSISSCDSGYVSRKGTGSSVYFEKDEEIQQHRQNPPLQFDGHSRCQH